MSWDQDRVPLLLSRRLWRTGRDADAMMQGYPIGLLAVDRLWIALPGTAWGQRKEDEREKKLEAVSSLLLSRL